MKEKKNKTITARFLNSQEDKAPPYRGRSPLAAAILRAAHLLKTRRDNLLVPLKENHEPHLALAAYIAAARERRVKPRKTTKDYIALYARYTPQATTLQRVVAYSAASYIGEPYKAKLVEKLLSPLARDNPYALSALSVLSSAVDIQIELVKKVRAKVKEAKERIKKTMDDAKKEKNKNKQRESKREGEGGVAVDNTGGGVSPGHQTPFQNRPHEEKIRKGIQPMGKREGMLILDYLGCAAAEVDTLEKLAEDEYAAAGYRIAVNAGKMLAEKINNEDRVFSLASKRGKKIIKPQKALTTGACFGLKHANNARVAILLDMSGSMYDSWNVYLYIAFHEFLRNYEGEVDMLGFDGAYVTGKERAELIKSEHEKLVKTSGYGKIEAKINALKRNTNWLAEDMFRSAYMSLPYMGSYDYLFVLTDVEWTTDNYREISRLLAHHPNKALITCSHDMWRQLEEGCEREVREAVEKMKSRPNVVFGRIADVRPETSPTEDSINSAQQVRNLLARI